MSPPDRPKATWKTKNFVTEVFLPSLFRRKGGTRPREAPVFPPVAAGQVGLTWIGHASFLIQTGEHNILVDPNWANWLLVMRRLRHAGVNADHLPNIDLVLITHAHFDHLNRRSLRQVASGQPIVVPEGVGSLVKDLGFDQVHEMGWWDRWNLGGLELHFVPAKHWGARVLVDRHRGYGGYVLNFHGRRVYHVGDTAAFDGFKEIGERMEPEIVLMPVGAYEPPSGRDHHIGPEEAVEAFQTLRAKTLIPMHFGTYQLSYEPMHEPPQRLMQAALEQGISHRVRFLIEGMPQVL